MYYITGFDVAKGTITDDVSGERPYFELGWEVVTTHFDAKRMKKTGQIESTHDVIVTCSGREFIYGTEFRQVIDYSEFSRRAPEPHECKWLTRRYADGRIPIAYFDGDVHTPVSRYRYLAEDRDALQRMVLPDVAALHGRIRYCCFCVRRRRHGDYRNVTDETAKRVLLRLAECYERIFIVGMGAEHLNAPPAVQHVSLQTYAALISQPLCDLVLGTMTGPMQLASLISRARVCAVILNYDGYDVDGQNHPVNLGKCIRLSTSEFRFVDPSNFLDALEAGTLWQPQSVESVP
jgi:hypothetical protein